MLETTNTLWCKGCDQLKPREDFSRCSAIKRGYQHRCKLCFKNRYPQNTFARARNLKSKYGISLEQYEMLSLAQNDVCAICEQPESKIHTISGIPVNLAVDHDRSCCPQEKTCGRCLRGLLCDRCNRAVGMFRDSPAILRSAIAYLESDKRPFA